MQHGMYRQTTRWDNVDRFEFEMLAEALARLSHGSSFILLKSHSSTIKSEVKKQKKKKKTKSKRQEKCRVASATNKSAAADHITISNQTQFLHNIFLFHFIHALIWIHTNTKFCTFRYAYGFRQLDEYACALRRYVFYSSVPTNECRHFFFGFALARLYILNADARWMEAQIILTLIVYIQLNAFISLHIVYTQMHMYV